MFSSLLRSLKFSYYVRCCSVQASSPQSQLTECINISSVFDLFATQHSAIVFHIFFKTVLNLSISFYFRCTSFIQLCFSLKSFVNLVSFFFSSAYITI